MDATVMSSRIYMFVTLMGLLKLLARGDNCYDSVCPLKSQWYLRSLSYCNVNKSYSCLFNNMIEKYQENCIGSPVQQRKGFKSVIRGGLDRKKCGFDRYQPTTFTTEGQSNCLLQMSYCTSEGLVKVDNGTTVSDRSCRCDYTKHYAFVNQPTQKCKCIPTKEDCSCYVKICRPNYILSPDYQCIPIYNWTGSIECPEIKILKTRVDTDKAIKMIFNEHLDLENGIYTSTKVVTTGVCMISMMLIVVFLRPKCLRKKRFISPDLEGNLSALRPTAYEPSRGGDSSSRESSEIVMVSKKTLKRISKDPTYPLKEGDFDVKTEIKVWRKKDNNFVTTKASRHVFDCLKKHSCVTVVGKLGRGKRSIMRNSALQIEKDGYSIIPIKNPEDIKEFYYPLHFESLKLFVIENFCGISAVDIYQVHIWKRLKRDIERILEDKSVKIIVSCQNLIFEDPLFLKINLFDECVCDIDTSELKYDSEELKGIAISHLHENAENATDYMYQHTFFPLLCFLSNQQHISNINHFVKDPYSVYKSMFDEIINRGDDHRLTLTLCVMFNNHVDESFFTDEMNNEIEIIFQRTCETLGFDLHTPREQLKSYFDQLLDIYLVKEYGVYKTIHEILFNFIACYFGQKIVECIIQYAVSPLIHQVCQLEDGGKKTQDEFQKCTVCIPESGSKLYFCRFVNDWKKGRITIVFSNRNFKSLSFQKNLISHMKDVELLKTLINKTDEVTGDTPLTLSCYLGYTEMVQWLIINESDVNYCYSDGSTSLLLACQEGYTEIVALLLQRRCGVNVCNVSGLSPLFMACKYDHLKAVKILLENEADPNQCTTAGTSPLIVASQNGNVSIVDALIHKNADVNIRSTDGVTALFGACEKGFREIVSILLKANAYVNALTRIGASPLYIACQNGHIDVVEMLIDKNAHINEITHSGATSLFIACHEGHINIVNLLLIHGADPDYCRFDFTTPLFIACTQGNSDIVSLLLAHDADINICNNMDMSTLYTACKNGRLEIICKLLNYEMNTNKRTIFGDTALFVACHDGHEEIVKVLLDSAVDINLPNNYGESPLYVSCSKGYTNIVKLLLSKKPNVNIITKTGETPLYVACNKGYSDIVRALVDSNSNVNETCNDGRSPLYEACFKSYEVIAKYLVQHGANVNFSSKNKETPLYVACCNGSITIADILLRNGADINLSTSNGETPLTIADQKGHRQIVQLLKKFSIDINKTDEDEQKSTNSTI